ncbi:MAG TPA: hypothetical protein VGN79_14380 [Devosia sp.]|nr:hypothetical protein [Devosia sp.]
MINPRKGEVALGEGILRFDLDALERLQAAHGVEWWQSIVTGLGNLQPSMLYRCLQAAKAPWPDLPLSDIADAVGDALCLSMNGKTRADLIEDQAEPAEADGEAPEKPTQDPLDRIRAAAYRMGLDPADADVLTPWQIAKVVEIRADDRWEELVHSSWLTAHLCSVGWHMPKDFPKTPNDLLKKAEPAKAPKTREEQILQMQAFIYAVTGKWKSLETETGQSDATELPAAL